MKQNHKITRKNRLFELRQHVKTPPSLHALVDLAFHINSIVDDENTIPVPLMEVRQNAASGTLTYMLEDRFSHRINFSSYFRDPDERLSWDSIFSEVAESLEGSDPKRIGIIRTGMALVQTILLETIIMYYVMPPAAALLAWPGNVN
jgi:hypothetical protein